MKKFKGLIGLILSIVFCLIIANYFDVNFLKKDINNNYKLINGYKLETYIKGLNNPSSICFDKKGNLYIAENTEKTGKISIYSPLGEYKELVNRLNSTIGYITVDEDTIYISHKGKVSKYNNGELIDIVNNLPSQGDYSNNGISIGNDDMLYITQGSATNSGVVGVDNYKNGWLSKSPYFHDIPSMDMILKGDNFVTENPFTEDKNDVAKTNGFLPFNMPANINDQIKGTTISNASILRANKDGSYIESFVTGVRNPKNIINLEDGSIFVGVQGMEDRGSRAIANGKDYLYKLSKDEYVGWPDFEGGESISKEKFRVEGKKQPLPITYDVKGKVASPLISFGESGRIGYMDISKDEKFGFKEQLFIPFSKGDKEDAKVLIVNTKDKTTQEFLVNDKEEGFLKNPSQCIFSPEGELYILESEKGQILKVNKSNSNSKKIFNKTVPIEYFLISGTIIFTLIILIFIKMGKTNRKKSKK